MIVVILIWECNRLTDWLIYTFFRFAEVTIMLRGRAARARANRRESEPNPRAGGLFTLGGVHGDVKKPAAEGTLDGNYDAETANSQVGEVNEHGKMMERDHGKVTIFLEPREG